MPRTITTTISTAGDKSRWSRNPRRTSHPLNVGASENAGWKCKQNKDDKNEGDRVFVFGRQIAGAECLHKAKNQTADDRAARIADTAHHRSGKALQSENSADVVIRERNRRYQDASDRANGGRKDERERRDSIRVDANQLCRQWIGRRCQHRFAEQRAIEEPSDG